MAYRKLLPVILFLLIEGCCQKTRLTLSKKNLMLKEENPSAHLHIHGTKKIN